MAGASLLKSRSRVLDNHFGPIMIYAKILVLVTTMVLAAQTAVADSIRIENADDRPLSYSVRRQDSRQWSQMLRLDGKRSHSFSTNVPLVISYWTDEPRFLTLHPDRQYRLDDVRRGEFKPLVETLRPIGPQPVTPKPVAPKPVAPKPAEKSPAVEVPERDAPAVAKPMSQDSSAGASPEQPESRTPGLRVPLRQVTIRAVADDTYRRMSNWQDRIRQVIAGLSKYYERYFAIRFELVAIDPWPYRALEHDIDSRWESLLQLDPNGSDVIVAFAGLGQYHRDQDTVVFTGHLGRAAPFGQHVIVSGWSDYHHNREITVLIHEFGHIFGAFHVDQQDSVMQPGYEQIPLEDIIAGKVRFGNVLERVVQLSRDLDFHRGVASLTEEDRREIQTLCRRHRLAREQTDESDDPISAGYRYLAQRASLAAERLNRQADRTKADYSALPVESRP